MRRRRLPSRRGSDAPTALVRATRSSDFRYLEHVVALGYTLRALASTSRAYGKPDLVRLVEARRVRRWASSVAFRYATQRPVKRR